MLNNAILIAICLGMISILFLVGHYITSKLKVVGLGLFSVKAIAFVDSKRWSGFYLADYNLEGELDTAFHRMIRSAKLSFCLFGCQIAFDRSQLKLLLVIKSLNVFLSPPSTRHTNTNSRHKSKPSRFIVKLAILAGKLIIRLIRYLWIVKIDRCNFIFTQLPESLEGLLFWNALQVSLNGLVLFDKTDDFKLYRIIGKEIIYGDQQKYSMTTRTFLEIPELRLSWSSLRNTTPSSSYPAPLLKLLMDQVKIDLWPTTLLLIASAIADTRDPSHSPGTDNAPTELDIMDLVLGSTCLLSAFTTNVSLRIHLPILKSKSQRFESLDICWKDFRIFCSLTPRETPMLIASCEVATISSTAAKTFGSTVVSVMQKLFENNFDSRRGAREEFLNGSRIVLSNCIPTELLLTMSDGQIPINKLREWIDAAIGGQPVWSVSHDAKDKYLADIMVKLSKNIPQFYDMLWGQDQPLHHHNFTVLQNSIVIRLSHLHFDVPFEYPLSNLFDHLSYFIGIVQSPFPKESERQTFNLFNKAWHLIVQADEAAFNIADSPFEGRLAKCLYMKQLMFPKFSRMDKLFWKQCRKEIERVTDYTSGSGWIPYPWRPLINASDHPEILRGNPYLAKRFVKLHEKLFTLYKAHIQEETGFARPLFHAGANDVNFKINWDPSFADSMATLLNSMEGDSSFSDDEVGEFGLFLGGFLDVSAKQLAVTLRNYAIPLCHSEAIRLLGLLFLVEEPSYSNAKTANNVRVIEDMPEGRWNLHGLDEYSQVLIKKTILPLKIYHSILVSLFGEQSVLGGFSPLFEGVFQMLDRAFELFTKPSEELSPSLPFWDKLRLLLRGTTSSIQVKSTCKIVCIAGTDLYSDDEAISIVFPQGLTLGLDGAHVRLKITEAIAFLNSERESLLKWLHRTTGASFFRADFENLRLSKDMISCIPIVSFPSLDFEIKFEIYGLDGRKPIPHNAIRVCAASSVNLPDDADYDSYRFFRIHRLMISININTGIPDSKFLIFYYRELERWLARGFARFVMPPVQSGRLFQFGTLTKVATPKLSSVLTDIQLKLFYDGFFCVRGLQYFDTKDFGGVLLSSKGRTRISQAWRRSDIKSANPNYGHWFCYFAEYDFSNMRLGIITKDSQESAHLLRSKDFPLEFRDVAIFDVLTAPRLFYIAINEGCFKRDPDAAVVQRRTIGDHLSSLSKEIDSLAVRLRNCDPHSDVERFAQVKRELTALLEQHEYISKSLKVEPDKPQASNHHAIIQNAKLVWHQQVRDAVFSLVDQEFQFHRCNYATIYKAIRALEDETKRMGLTDTTRRVSSPASLASPKPDTDTIFEALFSQEAPMEVEHEDLEKKKDHVFSRDELLADPISLHGNEGIYVSLGIDIDFVHPQIVLLDVAGTLDSAIVVTAQAACLKYGTLKQSEYGERMGRRTKIVLEHALFHGAFRKDFASWPPLYPVEYLLTDDTETSKFKKLSEKVRVTFVYDVSNKGLRYYGVGSPIKRLFGQGDKIRVDAGAISLITTSELYTALYNVIVGLLVYRDPTQKMRHEQLESLVLATNIFNQAEIAKTLYAMQEILLMRKRHVEGKLMRVLHHGSLQSSELIGDYNRLKGPWDELALVVDAMHTVRANRERLKQRQSRLLLDVMIRKIQWIVFQTHDKVLCEFSLDGIHSSWLSAEDGCQSNLVEIRLIKGLNRLPNAFYKTLIALVPEEIKVLLHSEMGFRGIGTQGNSIRFFFKARPPVGGIRIIEHLELNLTPLQFQLTYDIAEELIKFFFPERKAKNEEHGTKDGNCDEKNDSENEGEADGPDDTDDDKDGDGSLMSGIKSGIKSTTTSFLSHFGDRFDSHDVALMKTRAVENCSFIYITVPASQHLVSYKGRGESSITDVESFLLRLPDFEYHSQILSWLEFFLKLRRDSISVVLSNVGALVKDKIKRLGQANVPETDEAADAALARTASRLGSYIPKTTKDESSKEAQERKAKMLLGKSYQK